MYQEVVVNYKIRIGFGPEWADRVYHTAFDDLPKETTRMEIYEMARKEFVQRQVNSIDYQVYGENWFIGEIELI